MSATQSTPHGLKHISPERLLVGDVIILFRLLVRAVGRAFGVSGEGSTLLTLIVIGSVVRGVRRAFSAPRTQVRKARSSPGRCTEGVAPAVTVAAVRVDELLGLGSRVSLMGRAVKSNSSNVLVDGIRRSAIRPAILRLLEAAVTRLLPIWP
jgi:hypothetical protein